MSADPSRRARLKMILGVLLLRGVPFWTRSRRRRIARYCVLAGYLYVGAFLTLLAAEDRLLFPGATIARKWDAPADYLRVSEQTFRTADGDDIHAWFSAPEGWQPQQGAILISHGNGNNLSSMSEFAYRWREALGRAVLLYDYPGYGKSSGHPTEAGCYAAGEAALQWLTDAQAVPMREIVLVGVSLGGAIAVELATRHPVRLLVTHGAFTSFPNMVQTRLPIYPARYLLHNQMNNEAKIPLVQCPVFIAHGTADRIVPFQEGERLFAAAREPKQFLRLEGQGHDPPNSKDLYETVQQLLVKTNR
jgi:fermentation-respiration switch protein FrsA (DUF1100 family)